MTRHQPTTREGGIGPDIETLHVDRLSPVSNRAPPSWDPPNHPRIAYPRIGTGVLG